MVCSVFFRVQPGLGVSWALVYLIFYDTITIKWGNYAPALNVQKSDENSNLILRHLVIGGYVFLPTFIGMLSFVAQIWQLVH